MTEPTLTKPAGQVREIWRSDERRYYADPDGYGDKLARFIRAREPFASLSDAVVLADESGRRMLIVTLLVPAGEPAVHELDPGEELP